MEGIHKKLKDIQTQIKAPKNLYNSFGKYKYRNAEGICEAVKPYLEANDCALTLSDEIQQVGDRYYIKATATLADDAGSVSVTAYAREALEKKGMDDSQITGTASSYARKYALNGLFLLDDTKDADTDEYQAQTTGKPKPEEHKCARCGQDITPAPTKDGEWNVNAIVAYSLKKYGSKYCAECMKKLEAKQKEVNKKKSET